jgi:hypothetical protein
MALLGTAALAMWWRVTEDVLEEFEDWHSHEHFAERLAIPGFLRGSRWKSREPRGRFFVMYELSDYSVLSSAEYLKRLNAPSPWSTKMMPHHQGMIRTQCRVLHSRGGAVAGNALTVRLSPTDGREELLQGNLAEVLARIVSLPRIAGAHLLRHEEPAIAQTTEQKIRGGDRKADWVIVVTAFDAEALIDVVRKELHADALAAFGVMPGAEVEHYVLSHSATSGDIASI